MSESPGTDAGLLELIGVEKTFDVRHHGAGRLQQGLDVGRGQGGVFLMGHCHDERVDRIGGIDGADLDAGVFMGKLGGVRVWVGCDDANALKTALASIRGTLSACER